MNEVAVVAGQAHDLNNIRCFIERLKQTFPMFGCCANAYDSLNGITEFGPVHIRDISFDHAVFF
ncbi:hypothetical protein D3C85_1766490 [compost metagenome]